MKYLLLGMTTLISSALFAQNKEEATKKQEALQLKLNEFIASHPILKNQLLPKDSITIIPGKRTLTPGTYFLRQDNMPCIVPDTKEIAAIPNTAPSITLPFKTTIPNPSQKLKIEN